MSAAALALSPATPSSRPLGVAMALSAAAHGALILGLGFAYPDTAKTLRDRALDIILVNAKSATKPKDAQALAQSHLDGGGNTDENRRAKTPLPPTRQQTPGSDVEQMQRRVQDLEARQQQLLTEARTMRTVAPAPAGEDRNVPAPNTSVRPWAGSGTSGNQRAMLCKGSARSTATSYRWRKKRAGSCGMGSPPV